MGDSGCKFVIIHEVLSKENNLLSASMLCGIAGVSRSGYYRWLKAANIRKERETKEHADFEQILTAYRHRGYDKGARVFI